MSETISIESYLEEIVALDRPLSKKLATEGMSRALGADRVQMWKAAADRWLGNQIRGREFWADVLMMEVGYLPDVGANKVNVVGAWFSAKSKQGAIQWTGEFMRSARPGRHVGLQRVWRIQ
jgi:hypothetical protein